MSSSGPIRTNILGTAVLATVCAGVLGLPASFPTAGAVPLVGAIEPVGPGDFTEEFFLENCDFVTRGRNTYWSLRPGWQLHLAGNDAGEEIELFITVLDEVQVIPMVIGGETRNVRTRVIEEREFIDGQLYEISRNFYARCAHTNSVFYFGEDVCFYENDVCVDTRGSWRAGVDGAVPGIIMPGTVMLGARYFQEQAPGVALDRARHRQMGVTVVVPAGTLTNCLVVEEDSAIEAGAESTKVYAPGIGLIKDGVLELVEYGLIE